MATEKVVHVDAYSDLEAFCESASDVGLSFTGVKIKNDETDTDIDDFYEYSYVAVAIEVNGEVVAYVDVNDLLVAANTLV